MEKTMVTIDTLISKRKEITNNEQFENWVTTMVNITPYVGYGEKCVYADNIVSQCCLKNGELHVDSAKQYLLYIYTLLLAYTNIDLGDMGAIAIYDELTVTGILPMVLNMIPDMERTEFSTILKMKVEDFLINENNTKKYIDREIEKISSIIATGCAGALETLGEKIDTLDDAKVKKLIKMINK